VQPTQFAFAIDIRGFPLQWETVTLAAVRSAAIDHILNGVPTVLLIAILLPMMTKSF
jgi:hypothetical protein